MAYEGTRSYRPVIMGRRGSDPRRDGWALAY
jgi:hypothetical protein